MQLRHFFGIALIVVGGASGGCGGDDIPGDAAALDAPIVEFAVAPPAPPVFTPCPPGWREVMVPDVSTPVCDPWPEGGIEECAAGEAHFPGDEGCTVVGPACPPGPFPEGLPTDRTVRYVDATATASGDGTMAAPYRDIATALRSSGSGDVVAVAKGTYDEELAPRGGVTIWGACAAETRLMSSRPAVYEAVVSVERPGVEIRGVSIGGARPAIYVRLEESSLRLEGVIIEDTVAAGVGVSGATLVAEDVVFRDVRATGTGNFGTCVNTQDAATVTLRRTILQRCTNAGLTADHEGTFVRVEDSAFLDNQALPNGTFGRAASFTGHSEGVLERVYMGGNREVGLKVIGAGTRVDVSDLVVEDTLAQDDGFYGEGLSVWNGAELTARRLRIERSHEAAIYTFESGVVTLEDVVVNDTLPQDFSSLYGSGIAIRNSPFAATRMMVVKSHNAGVSLNGAMTVTTFVDLSVVGTRSTVTGGRFGRGFNAQSGATAEVTRSRLLRNRDLAVFAHQSTLHFVDLAVESTMAQACGDTTCTTNPSGAGLVVVEGGIVDVDRFIVTDSALAGVQIANAGDLDLHHGEIRDNPIGANVQVSGYDLMRLQDDVIYRDNGTNLDGLELPIPMVGDAIPEM